MRNPAWWLAVAALFGAAPCFAQVSVAPAPNIGVAAAPAPAVEIGEQNAALESMLGNHADEAALWRKASFIGDGLSRTQINIPVRLHPWLVDSHREEVGQVSDLTSSADRALHLDKQRVPSPEVMQSLKYIQDVDGQGRVSFQRLPDNVMGIYNTGTGLVGLSHYMPELARKMDSAVLASVLFHEVAGHAADPNVKTGTVEDNEGLAFFKQWQYLRDLFPTGEEMATLVLLRRGEYKAHPTRVNAVALGLAEALDALWGTGGDPRKIEALVHKLYPNGEPSTPSA